LDKKLVRDYSVLSKECYNFVLTYDKLMQKEDFIYLSAYTAVALAIPDGDGGVCNQIDTETQPFFLSHLADIKTIVATGMAYRKAHREEDNKNKLEELLLANSTLQSSSDDQAIKLMLDHKVENDFKTGKVAIIKGWVLSLTEARECALFSMLQY
jgi:hypothetical protein